MAQVRYKVVFKDSIENTPVTGSIVRPFNPPTSPPFSTSTDGITTIIDTDDTLFTGYDPQLAEEEPSNLFSELQNRLEVRANAVLDELEGKINKNEGLVKYLTSRGLASDLNARAQQALRLGLVQSTEEYVSTSKNARTSPEAGERSKALNLSLITKLEEERLTATLTESTPTEPMSYGFRVTTPGYSEKVFFQVNLELTPTKAKQEEQMTEVELYPTSKGLDVYLKSRGLPTTLEYKVQEIIRLGIATEEEYTKARANGKNRNYNIQLIKQLEEQRLLEGGKSQEVDLGVVVLQRIVAEPSKEITPFLQIDSKAIIENIPEINKEQGLSNLRSLLESRGEDLKNLLVKSIVPILTEFGLTEIYKLLEKAPTQELLEQAMAKLKKLCPSQTKLQQLILLKSKYSEQVNKFYTSINAIQTTVVSSDKIAKALNITLQVLSTARQAANIVLSNLPVTPGAAPALINIQKDVEEKLRPSLTKISTILTKMVSTFVFLGSIIALIQQLLNALDILIRFCAEKLNIPYQTINTTMGAIPNLATPTQTTYKGFTFEIITDTQNTTAYPKRYAVAKDKYNIIQLKSQSSFTPNPDVLIAELKFTIDRGGLRGD